MIRRLFNWKTVVGGILSGAVVLSLLLGIYITSPHISYDDGYIGIELGARAYAAPIKKLPPTLDIRFEPSGTHIKDGYLKIRLDFYPSPEDKSYAQQHVEVPIIPEGGYPGKVDENGQPVDQKEYNDWYDSLPTEWVTNPCLCHFVTVSSDITLAELQTYIENTFYADVTATIDDIMVQSDSAHLISPFMREKCVLRKETITTLDKEQLISDVNARLSALSIIGGAGGTVEPIEPDSIDVGVVPFDGAGAQPTSTHILFDNPANADGLIDTFQFWFFNAGSNVKAAIFYGSGTSYTCRDWATIGSVPSGSTQTFSGLEIDVETGDFAGTYFSGGHIEWQYVAGGHRVFKNGDQTTTGVQTYDGPWTGQMAIYATGTEGGGEPDISNSPSGWTINGITGNGAISTNTTYYSNPNGDTTQPNATVADGDCYFTLTNDSTIDIDIAVTMTDFSGGDANMTNSNDGSNGSTSYGAYAWYSGMTYSNKVIVKTSGSGTLWSSSSPGDDIKWGIEVLTRTDGFTGPDMSQATITITASAS